MLGDAGSEELVIRGAHDELVDSEYTRMRAVLLFVAYGVESSFI
jgi:hypothetical protein